MVGASFLCRYLSYAFFFSSLLVIFFRSIYFVHKFFNIVLLLLLLLLPLSLLLFQPYRCVWTTVLFCLCKTFSLITWNRFLQTSYIYFLFWISYSRHFAVQSLQSTCHSSPVYFTQRHIHFSTFINERTANMCIDSFRYYFAFQYNDWKLMRIAAINKMMFIVDDNFCRRHFLFGWVCAK